MDRPDGLDADGEAAWTRFQRGLSWNEGFALVLLFCDYARVAELFRQRLADIYRARVRGLRLLQQAPASPAQLTDTLLRSLLRPDTTRGSLSAPLWVELTQGQDEHWTQARREFLARLNERRAVLVEHHHWPVILLLPTTAAPDLPAYAPDLWAIRHLSLTLGNWLVDTDPVTTPAAGGFATRDDATTGFAYSDAEQAMLGEWQRVRDSERPDAGVLRAGWAASGACGRRG